MPRGAAEEMEARAGRRGRTPDCTPCRSPAPRAENDFALVQEVSTSVFPSIRRACHRRVVESPFEVGTALPAARLIARSQPPARSISGEERPAVHPPVAERGRLECHREETDSSRALDVYAFHHPMDTLTEYEKMKSALFFCDMIRISYYEIDVGTGRIAMICSVTLLDES